MATPLTPPGVLAYLTGAYAPLAILAYGSYADGSWGPDSDFDALVLTAGGPERHDMSVVGSVQLDAFVYPVSRFDEPFAPSAFPQLADATLLLDTEGRGQTLIDRVRAWRATQPLPTPEELRSQATWCRKMLRRAGRGDTEGLFRWHWVLVDSLEIFCLLAGQPYQGPKKSLRWLAEARPEAYALYSAALARPELPALERWIAHLEGLCASLPQT